MTTGIQWTDETWNPVVGCAHVSPGCDGCYAARDSHGRLAHLPTYAGLTVRRPGELPRFTGEVRVLPERLDQPLRWRRPRRVFVNSMSDLFHADVPVGYQEDVFGVMARAQRHTFQVLTKRPQLMERWFEPAVRAGFVHWAPVMDRVPGAVAMRPEEWPGWPLPNVWLGTSIESDRYVFRARHLAATPAAVRFLSVEPMIGPVDLTGHLDGIGWVIVGCESGPKSRPLELDWVRDVRDVCAAAGVALFVKQLSNPLDQRRPLKDLDEFPPDLRIREYPS